MRAAIYARMSTNKQAGASPEAAFEEAIAGLLADVLLGEIAERQSVDSENGDEKR